VRGCRLGGARGAAAVHVAELGAQARAEPTRRPRRVGGRLARLVENRICGLAARDQERARGERSHHLAEGTRKRSERRLVGIVARSKRWPQAPTNTATVAPFRAWRGSQLSRHPGP